MKRSIFFVFILFFLSLTVYFLNPAFAQEVLTPTITPSMQATQSPIIKYDLAYPGILPDHPLYKLKVLRDRIFLALTSDPLKKINFYLQQADKGMLATAMLVDKGKITLAEETALKAEHNMTLVSNNLRSYYRKQADPSNASNNVLVEKLKTASLKHQEVLNSLLKRVPEDQQKTFETVLDFSKRNIETIEKTTKDYQSGKEEF